MLAKKLVNFFLKIIKIKNFFICGTGNNGKDGKIASIYLKKKNQVNEVFDTIS